MTSMIEKAALAILNSDREAAGFPPVESRETIPDSDGYVRNAIAVLQAIREPDEAMIEAAANTPGMKAVNDMVMMQAARGYPLPPEAVVDGKSPLEQAWAAMLDAAPQDTSGSK